MPFTLCVLTVAGVGVFVLHAFTALPVVFVVMLGIFILLYIGGIWAQEPSSCPNNFLAKVVATAAASMNNYAVSRRVCLVAASVSGNLEIYWSYSFLLLDLIFLSSMLQNVVKAVTVPSKPLMLTTIIGLIVMYEYSITGFHFFHTDYNGSCESVLDCTTTTIYQGLRMDIGSAMTPVGVQNDDRHWYSRMGFDLSYFVVITTILMNVIFGIIIDAFGSLRDETMQREDHMRNKTFISCIDRGEADRAGQTANIGLASGFDFLENVTQNRRSYLNFIFYLQLKDPVEYTGPEARIHHLLEDEDVSWMPLNACRLMERWRGEESEIAKLKAEVISKTEMIEERLGKAIEEQGDKLEKLREIVEMEAGGKEEIQKKRASAKRLAVQNVKKRKQGLARTETQLLDDPLQFIG
eukprot:gnl/MRDRNA2_/MRDRNA2_108130_c0_seq1.p1 gnl/MRDRNA2_/MRDRNA2_108130_c0~~gnl/MRDRNA2_/MRDRNA2_108130_c0_seq1.p1  ORF type:complete len:472 (+),score=67.05 gnl/MRDRNA2_/MRDRNA2_108130_c0_seq1:190-1416(+)